MAAPPSKTLRDLNGTWVMNKTLSDPTDPALAIQGIGWLTRKTIGLATVTLQVKEYTDSAGVTHIDVSQTATGGLKGTDEERSLDNNWREHSDWLFGKVKGRNKWVASKDEIEGDDAFLKGNWADGEAAELIYGFVESLDRGWTAAQVWGFQIVNGERRHTRNVVVSKGSERAEIRMVYDYVPA